MCKHAASNAKRLEWVCQNDFFDIPTSMKSKTEAAIGLVRVDWTRKRGRGGRKMGLNGAQNVKKWFKTLVNLCCSRYLMLKIAFFRRFKVLYIR